MIRVYVIPETSSRKTWRKASELTTARSGDTACLAYIHRGERDMISFYYDGFRIMVGRYSVEPRVSPLVEAVFSEYLRTGSRELRVVIDPTHSGGLRLGDILLGCRNRKRRSYEFL